MRLILSIILLISITANAQENLQVLFGYEGAVSATSYMPSIQKMDSSHIELNISYDFLVGNSSITYGSLLSIYNKKSLTKADVNSIIDEMDDENRIGLNQDFVVFALGIKHNLFKKPLYWNFTVSDRMSLNIFYDKELPQLLWQGNKQFLGQTVDLSNTYLSGIYFRDYAIGLKRNIFSSDKLDISAAFRFNYYQGIAGLSMEHSNITFETSEDANYVDLNYDLEYRHTGISNFNLFESKGEGYGADIGASLEYNKRLSFHASVIDWGSITFSENTITNKNNMTLNFGGLDNEGVENPTAYADSLIAPISSTIEGNDSFKKNIGTKLLLMASYKIKGSNFISSNKVIHAYYRQNISKSVDGVNKPMVALGFNNTMLRMFNVGFNSAWTSDDRVVFGGLLGVTFNHFDISVYSNDFTGYISPNGAKGAGFGFLLKANLF